MQILICSVTHPFSRVTHLGFYVMFSMVYFSKSSPAGPTKGFHAMYKMMPARFLRMCFHPIERTTQYVGTVNDMYS